MTQIVLDPATSEALHRSKVSTRLVDVSGRLLGLFTPQADPARLEPQIDEQELQRRLKKGGGRPLADILRDLEQRP